MFPGQTPVRGVPSSCFLHLPIRLVATDAASRKLSLSKSWPGKWIAPPCSSGAEAYCLLDNLAHRKVWLGWEVLRKVRRGIPQIPREHTMTVGQKPQLITTCLLGLLVSCSFRAIQGTVGTSLTNVQYWHISWPVPLTRSLRGRDSLLPGEMGVVLVPCLPSPRQM